MGLLSLDFSVEISDCEIRNLEGRESKSFPASFMHGSKPFQARAGAGMFLDADPMEQD
jgi:hypothetical protein